MADGTAHYAEKVGDTQHFSWVVYERKRKAMTALGYLEICFFWLNKTGILPGCSCLSTTVWFHQLNFKEKS